MKRKCIVLCLIFGLLFCISIDASLAQSTNNKINNEKSITEKFEYKQPSKTESPSYSSLLLKTLFILVIFGLGIYFIFRYISKRQGFLPVTKDIIKLVSTVPVGTNRFVQLIEVGTHYYLIGSTESGIILLSEITDNESINMIKLKHSKETPVHQQINFIQFIKDIIGNIPKKQVKSDKNRTGFLARQKERLKNMNNRIV